jgi:hypothetical protein
LRIQEVLNTLQNEQHAPLTIVGMDMDLGL